MKRLTRYLATLAVTLAPLAAFSQEIAIGEGLAVGWSQFYVADHLKLWEKQGLKATAVTFPSGRLVLDAVVGGRVLIGTAAETPVVFATLNELPVRILGTLNREEPFDLVATQEIKSIQDLKGKKIGYSQGTNAHYYLSKLLDKAGLKFSDITPVSLTPADFVTSLVNGGLDGFIWTEPHLSQAIAQGKGRFHTIRTPGLYRTSASIITLQSTLDQKPELVVKALRALLEADAASKKDPATAIRIVSERTNFDHELARSYWPRLSPDLNLDKAAVVRELEAQAKWAVANKLVRPDARIPDFNTIVVTGPLEAARKP
ncbi:MAG: NrtA/SsuA/CpmA family ABC transporter substrate-binding protein [Pseudomonadota bacterium]